MKPFPLLIMHVLNEEFSGQLQTAIEIFTNNHPKHFLYQLGIRAIGC